MKLDLILIDAFDEKYYEYCPFLSRLKKDNFSFDLTPIIGYQRHLASLFSGSWPKDINVWNTFRFSPQTSIFKWTLPFSFFKIFDYKFIKYFIDLISYLAAGVSDMMPVQIPIKIMNKFDIVLREPITALNSSVKPNFFNLLREHQISFSYFKGGLKYANKDSNKKFLANLIHLISRSDKRTIKNALKDNSDFKFIYLMELDGLTHGSGVDSLETKNKLKEIDRLLEGYFKKSNRPFVIISDHGVVEVKDTIDIISEIDSLGFVLGRDYLVFLESVIAVFWFFNQKAEEKIISALKEIKGGHILEKNEKREFGIDFKDRQFGDLHFLLEPGKIIKPDYYRAKNTAKAMHGYSPNAYKGIFLTNLKINKQVETINFIDIIPTIADFFGLGKIGQGRNLLD